MADVIVLDDSSGDDGAVAIAPPGGPVKPPKRKRARAKKKGKKKKEDKKKRKTNKKPKPKPDVDLDDFFSKPTPNPEPSSTVRRLELEQGKREAKRKEALEKLEKASTHKHAESIYSSTPKASPTGVELDANDDDNDAVKLEHKLDLFRQVSIKRTASEDDVEPDIEVLNEFPADSRPNKPQPPRLPQALAEDVEEVSILDQQHVMRTDSELRRMRQMATNAARPSMLPAVVQVLDQLDGGEDDDDDDLAGREEQGKQEEQKTIQVTIEYRSKDDQRHSIKAKLFYSVRGQWGEIRRRLQKRWSINSDFSLVLDDDITDESPEDLEMDGDEVIQLIAKR